MSHFETMFVEALAYALARNVVPSDEYYDEMTALQRQRAISIKGLASLEQIRHIMMAVNHALADGESFEDFHELNRRVGGVPNSAHTHGYAIDFVAPKFGSTTQIVRHLSEAFKTRGVAFDQAIIEYPKSSRSWVHLGYKRGDGVMRGRVFVIGG